MKITQIIGTKKLGHVMLDLETMGNKSNSAIISIGAVEFNLETGEIGDTFYSRVDIQSCLDLGLIINGSTVMWWLKQNEQARNKITEGEGSSLEVVLDAFTGWFGHLGKDVQIWGNGARFDIGILEDAYVACRWSVPWGFREERDLRTLVAFAPEIKLKAQNEFKGVVHDPIDDCKLQIDYASKIWNKIQK